jgi:ubiquinone/menaquinone biosynthesis C-methylase UbiE
VAYEQRYQDVASARDYNEAYRDKRTKRMSTSIEIKLLRRLLERVPRSGRLLNIPSGGGRLSDVLGEYCDLLIEADIGLGQLQYAREQAGSEADSVWMTADALDIPLNEASVDVAVCCRLSHHLPTSAERELLLHELLRVSRRGVIMTFFDTHSVKNLLRRVRRPFNRKPPKLTMSVTQVARVATECNARLAYWPSLSYLFSGHRYAMILRND